MNDVAQTFGQQLQALPSDGLPDWALALRQRAGESFSAHGLPTTRLEAWKYTSLRALERGIDSLASSSPGQFADSGTLAVEAHCQLQMVDGLWQGQHGELAAGVELLTLEAAMASGVPGLAELLTTLDTTRPDRSMAALNSATLSRGLVVRVPDGVDAGRLLLQWLVSDSVDQALLNSRVCLLLGEGAKLELVEQFVGRNAAQQPLAAVAQNLLLQASLGTSARLEHARLQESDAKTVLLTSTHISQGEQSRYRFNGLDLHGGLTRHDMHIQLLQPRAECEVNGAYVPSKRDHVDLQLAIDHAAPECTSRQFLRGVLRDRGRAVFRGRVHVWPGADGTEAEQSNANLLLSPHAEVDTKPELEIEADEVIASHGATVGQLDETAVFYLRSRGLSEASARQLLTSAFCQAAMDKIPDTSVRAEFAARLAKALGDTE